MNREKHKYKNDSERAENSRTGAWYSETSRISNFYIFDWFASLIFNLAQSDTNISLDDSNYPRWKIGFYESEKPLFEWWNTQQANIQDQ